MVFEKIATLISEQLGVDKEKISLQTILLEDLEADSLDLFQIINDIEDEFDVKIDDTEGIKTIQDVVNIVQAQQDKTE